MQDALYDFKHFLSSIFFSSSFVICALNFGRPSNEWKKHFSTTFLFTTLADYFFIFYMVNLNDSNRSS